MDASLGWGSTAARPTRSGLKAAASPAAAVLILAGAFHVYRGVPGEGVLFCAVGLAIAADSPPVGARRRPPGCPEPPGRGRWRRSAGWDWRCWLRMVRRRRWF